MASTSAAYTDEGEKHEFEHLDASDSTFEGDFSQTIALLEMEAEEVHIEVERSLEEVSD